ncbi:MAG: slipin family protein [Berryella intestinalis]|uniref:slipin family protein n=1 Tax=Berryella intestinalis TaxID=1531429 RepID=UPI002A580E70|nr:slipin family protein [Berryella intestinalis]MDD7369926.1 slipin family protein [Berryella intestinalis]MDY3128473.1 slipin family protein [Berryella intestinalis]
MMGMKKPTPFETGAQRLPEGRRTSLRDSVAVDVNTEIVGERASNSGIILFSTVVFAVTFGAVVLASFALRSAVDVLAVSAALVVASLATLSTHIAQEWERVVVLRLGRFQRLAGPGMFLTIPVFESLAMRTDSRVRVTTFGAERTLTSDLVPLDVDAVLFWVVWDAKAACMEVADFTKSVELAAQTALRDAIGRAGVAEVALRREQLDRELKKVLEEEVAPWGITIMSVQVRDILIPDELQNVMSLEAQAEQRKKARIILMEAEQDIAAMLDEAGESYADNDRALNLRAMHLLYESIKDTGSSVVVPSALSEGFGSAKADDLADILKKLGR